MTARKIGASSLKRLLGGWYAHSSRAPTYRQLEEALRLLILDGRLPIGVSLPGERQLAVELNVSRTTIAAANSALREQGFLASRHGSGSVTRLPRSAPTSSSMNVDESEIDFSIAALPAPKDVHGAYAEALAELPRHLPGIGYEPAGLPDLRAAIGDTCLTLRGVVCQSCRDTCPSGAIRFTPALRSAPRPTVETDRCTGCGACVAGCPVQAITVAAHG